MTTRYFHASRSSFASVKDPYKVLNVDRNASAKDIKKAYYALAKKYHPDVNKEAGAEERFHDIQAAYELLSDAEKKRQYDQFGAAGMGAGGMGGMGGNPGGGGGFNPFAGSEGIDFEELFKNAFGGAGMGGSGRRSANMHRVYRGEDIEVSTVLSFLEAAKGKSQTITYSALTQCTTCEGSGLKPGRSRTTCGSCGGTGTQSQLLAGNFHVSTTCSECGGSGVVINRSDACSTCHASGVVHESRSTVINIPPGVEDGVLLRVPREGDAPDILKSSGMRLENGDLFVRVRVRPHKHFRRDGSTLLYTAEIPMTTAALGGRIRVPTLDGEVDLTVPSGTQSGASITIPGRGLPKGPRGTSAGDMKVNFDVKIKRPQSAEETALLEALADTIKDSNAKRIYPPMKDNVSAGGMPSENQHHQRHGFLRDAFRRILGKGDDQNDDKTT
ncbi:hypothetical protein CANCADRAFT_4016 [Tortispora caseinolytica NRRL Y-17796]|uniref:DnaJ homolog 1, mitochondrial n=1 Tax=Tortispora caseinolytica NRRL Y-17796 TaxID=767744 RepID=A0A1E4TCF3_9ASCO|nr:hypothetical protein CANCADRAFT_4016 [Tortispora caseinolytica NRRL Y-17796]